MNFTFTEETPDNIEDLKRMAANKADANMRLTAVEELGKSKCKQAIDILWRLMINDLVYDIKQASFLRLQAFGEKVSLPRKAKGNLIKQIDKKIEKVLKSLTEQVTYPQFVVAFQKKLPEEFDVYQHDKKGNFDKWLKNIVNGLPADIKGKIKSSEI